MENIKESRMLKIAFEIPKLKNIRNIDDLEKYFWKIIDNEIKYQDNTKWVSDFIKETFEYHKKERFWLCYELALYYYADIEDYFNDIKKEQPKEIQKAFKYLGYLENMDLVPTKKENIKKNILIIFNYYIKNIEVIHKSIKA